MKTHSSSIFVSETDLVSAMVNGFSCADIASDASAADYTKIEFVPATAYAELKNELESSNKRILEAVSVATDTLKELIASHADNESLELRLQSQTENMMALRKFVEVVANASHFEGLHGDHVEQAQDLIARIAR